MERFLVTAPFTYRYGISIRHFQAGDIYVLHPEDQKLELEYWQSDSFEYKNFVHLLAKEPPAEPIIVSVSSEPVVLKMDTVDEPADEKAQPNVFYSDSEAPEVLITEEPEPYSRSVRKDELEKLPWAEVKAITENLGLKYTNKAESIELILSKEFE